jgi:hypothetical protein
MANTYLSRTFSTPTNGKKFTFSAWMKRSSISGDQAFFSTATGTPITTFRWNSDNKIYLFQIVGSSMVWEFATNALYRDVNGWYHLVIAFDSTENSAGDRLKLWINGEQVTSWSTQVNPALDMTPTMNTAIRHDVANNRDGNYFNGSMSHVHFIDGTAYDATAFGQYDANGVWTINTSPSVTYGNNGFFILKDGNSVTDQSGNSNDWTVGGGTLTKTEDSPSNVFAVFNATWNLSNGKNLTLTNGNTTTQSNSANWNGAISTIGVSTGKYYWEAKIVSATNNYNFGVVDPDVADVNNTDNIMNQVGYSGFYNFDGGETRIDDVVSTSDYGTFGNGDILGFALDKTNNQFSIYKNGTIIVTNASLGQGNGTVLPINIIYGTNQGSSNFNFGNGYFGTTAVSSAGTNASGIGIFEHDVPTGFTALSTKGLNL